MVIVHRASFLINKHSFFSQLSENVFKAFFFFKIAHEGDKIVVCPLLYIKYQISPKANFIDLIVRKRFSSCIPSLR